MRFNFEFFGREFGLIFSSRKTLKTPVAGVTNRTLDGMFVVFLDYDEIPYDWLAPELIALQEEFDLGTLHILKSGAENWHVVGFEKLTREEYQAVLSRSSCDPYFKKIPYIYGKRLNTLRLTRKGALTDMPIRHYATLKRKPEKQRVISQAHMNLFAMYYGIKRVWKNTDGFTQLIMARYKI